MNPLSFSHSGNIGDCWAAIPAMKQYHKLTGRKVLLYLVNGQEGKYYEGAVHPTKSESTGENVMLNLKMINMMIPLFKAQTFIEDCVVLPEGFHAEMDMDEIRRSNVGMPGLSINRWYFYVWPDLSCDTTKVWLEVPDSEKDLAKGKVLINRTERYLNENLDYSFLKKYEDDCLFIGTQREWNNFCMGFDLNIPKLNVATFLEFAQAVKQSLFFVGSQSQGFQLAQGLDHPRLLEACTFAPNVIVHGNGYDFLSQLGLEYLFRHLFTKGKAMDEEFKQYIESKVTLVNV